MDKTPLTHDQTEEEETFAQGRESENTEEAGSQPRSIGLTLQYPQQTLTLLTMLKEVEAATSVEQDDEEIASSTQDSGPTTEQLGDMVNTTADLVCFGHMLASQTEQPEAEMGTVLEEMQKLGQAEQHTKT